MPRFAGSGELRCTDGKGIKVDVHHGEGRPKTFLREAQLMLVGFRRLEMRLRFQVAHGGWGEVARVL